uniref:peptidylprolyl isomerase n=1 Tax=Alexandrium catenella TaxID=2925 RepID=A0A7S1QGV4_ALECA
MGAVASPHAAAGMTVKVAFTLSRSDGTVVDSHSSADPLEFVCGEGLVFPGLDRAVQGMAAGEAKKLELRCQDTFGDRDEEKLHTVPASQLPPGCKAGSQLKVRGPDGEDLWVVLVRLEGDTATLDLNHPLAGVPLTLSVTLLGCEAAPELPPFEVETVAPGDEKTYPSKGDYVTVHYAGALADGGKSFMSTREAGEPLRFRIGVGKALRGLDEGIALMSLGERALVRVPAVLAYGERGLEDVVPPNADLVFDVELLKIE